MNALMIETTNAGDTTYDSETNGTLLPILVKAVQELSAEVKTLKIEINELKNK
jgi:hypothetical protein